MTPDFVLIATPFALSAFLKSVLYAHLPKVRAVGLGSVKGYDDLLADENKKRVLLRYISHAEQKSLASITYVSSIVAAFVAVLREALTRRQIGVPLDDTVFVVVAAVIFFFAAVGMYLPVYLGGLQDGTLDEVPNRGWRWAPARRIFAFSISADFILASLAIILVALRPIRG